MVFPQETFSSFSFLLPLHFPFATLNSALSITIQFTIQCLLCPGIVSVRLSAAIAVDGFDFIRGCTFLVALQLGSSAARQLGLPPIRWMGPGASIVCSGCASDSSSGSVAGPAPAAAAVAVPLCAVHCCCVLLLLIFLSALLFIATEKCLPTTQGKLDCNFHRRQILFSLLTARASTVLLFPFPALLRIALCCVGQVIMWAEMLLMEFAVRCT